MRLYSIKDQVAEKFGPVFTAVNDGVAVRQFTGLLKQVDYVGEYDLYCLAEFDDDSGSISTVNGDTGFGSFSPLFVANGLDVKRFKDEKEEKEDA
ncbi:MAG: hypothetical protein GX640_16765 [Fibrobacter sp.]|nr:hypothetical protein [Fibrobacter sp.]